VCEPAGMLHTAFVRSDEPTGASAVGYLSVDNDRTNVFHLPVLGSGDGGILTTVADVHAFWRAFFAGRIVPEPWVGEMTRARLPATGASAEYGLGFWLDERRHTAMLEGADAGVSFRSVHDPQTNSTYTVMSNSTDGAWPIARLLQRWYEPSR
jgi:CubicO group peptidase (beta-lactamase class C family)